MHHKNERFSGKLIWACVWIVAAACAPEVATAAELNSEWALIGNNAYQQHFSPLTQINDHTVKRLGLKWYADLPIKDGTTGVPIVAGGAVYQSAALGKVFAN